MQISIFGGRRSNEGAMGICLVANGLLNRYFYALLLAFEDYCSFLRANILRSESVSFVSSVSSVSRILLTKLMHTGLSTDNSLLSRLVKQR